MGEAPALSTHHRQTTQKADSGTRILRCPPFHARGTEGRVPGRMTTFHGPSSRASFENYRQRGSPAHFPTQTPSGVSIRLHYPSVPRPGGSEPGSPRVKPPRGSLVLGVLWAVSHRFKSQATSVPCKGRRYCGVVGPFGRPRIDIPKSLRFYRSSRHCTVLVSTNSSRPLHPPSCFNGTVTSSNSNIRAQQSSRAPGTLAPSPTDSAHDEGETPPATVFPARSISFAQ